MKITKEFLKENGACSDGLDWFTETYPKGVAIATLCKRLMKEDHFTWAAWLLPKVMTKEQCVAFAIFCSREVLGIFEDKYPKDKRPRKAIEAAEKYLKEPSEKNREAVADAACAAYAARSATRSAAAYAAAYAASASADAVAFAAFAAFAAAYAAEQANPELKQKIVEYGLDLIKEKKK